MIKRYSQFTILLLFNFCISCGQTQKVVDNGVYVIDGNIKEVINKKTTSFGDMTMSTMDFKFFENDSLVADSYANGKSVECMIMSNLESDTINITGFLGFTAAFGFQIQLFKDTCLVRHFAKTDMPVYKLTKTDSLDFGVSVPCKSYILTLAKKPEFKKGGIIEGVIELTSNEYYSVSSIKGENKNQVRLTGYFRTQPLESTEDMLMRMQKQFDK